MRPNPPRSRSFTVIRADMPTRESMAALLTRIRACTVCSKHLPLGPNPVVRASASCRLLLIGQAPGVRVHETGIPWNDPSGDRLRQWLQLDSAQFYDSRSIAIVPTGFCYPGKGPSGDLPPRPECAPLWHAPLRERMPSIRLTLLIGSYAQATYLGPRNKATLTETVQHYAEYLPDFIPLPHPSPRNVRWFKAHPWFEAEVVPELRQRVHNILKR